MTAMNVHHGSLFNFLPSGKRSQKIWKITLFNGKTHYKWPFSIAMLNYQRVKWRENGHPVIHDDDLGTPLTKRKPPILQNPG